MKYVVIKKIFVFLQSRMSNRKKLRQILSLRLSVVLVGTIAILLMVILFAILRYSRKVVKEEALLNASQTLEATVQHIDNVLLSVEQATGNVYYDLLQHLDEPDRMFVYSKMLVKDSPYITGCAIAMQPYYYKDRGEYFMAYFYHSDYRSLMEQQVGNDTIVQSETFGNTPYTEQIWYTKAMQTGRPCWVGPLEDYGGGTITTFCLPIYDGEGHVVGVLAADVSIALLTRIVMAAKPSLNSYAVLLADDGTYIVHPDSSKRLSDVTLVQTDPSVLQAAKAMLAGETDYRYVRLDGTDNYVFYKPFVRTPVPGRSTEDLGWSAGIVLPEDDVFGEYNELRTVALIVGIVGLLFLFLFCMIISSRQLHPLRQLAKQTRRIADGNYEDSIPVSLRDDEIGRLQANFRQMQKALIVRRDELKQTIETLREKEEELEKAYEQAKEADHVKIAFLHRMSGQLMDPVNIIRNNVRVLCDNGWDLDRRKADELVDEILQNSKIITKQLNELMGVTRENLGK